MTTHHLGLDLGGTNIKVAVLRREGDEFRVLSTDTVDTGAAGGPEQVAANLVAAGQTELAHTRAVTVGLGVPGHFDPQTGRIKLFPNLPGPWPGFPLRDRLEDGLGMTIGMINDARAFALAEGVLGAGRHGKVVAFITLGTGVGGGLMIDGKLHLGAFGVAGELGHQTIVPDGPPCGCGNRGCLEALIRADVFAADAGRSTVEEVFAGARTGDERCRDAIARMTDYLGIGLANVVAMFGTDRIVIGGGIAGAGDLILEPIREAVRRHVTLVPTDELCIVPAELGRYAGAVGAALAGVLHPDF